MEKRTQRMLAAAVALVLCCLALGAGRPQEGGVYRRVSAAREGQDGIRHPGGAKRVPVASVTIAREGREEREFRLKGPQDRAGLQMRPGSRITLVAIVRPPDATDKSVLWTSDDPAVATVKDGVVTAKGRGYTIITATSVDGRRTDDYSINVLPLAREAKAEQGEPAVYRMPEPFEPSALRPYMGRGTAAIAGRAVVVFSPGPDYIDGFVVVPAASVTVIPAAGDYYLMRYVHHFLWGYKIEPPIPKEAEALVRTVPCDAAGNFTLAGLPAGRYSVYGSAEGAWADLGVVAVRAGEKKAVVLSN